MRPASCALLIAAAACGQCVVGSNGALSFDGVDDVAIVADQPALDGFGDFTVEYWAMRSGPVIGQRGIVGKWEYGPSCAEQSWGTWLTPGANVLVAVVPGCQYATATTSATLPVGVWRHVAVVRSGTVLFVYVDGVQEAAVGISGGAMPNSVAPLFIGAAGTTPHTTPPSVAPNSTFPGALDEVRVWNYARTPAQLASTRNVAITGVVPGLVGYWRCDDSSGQFAANLTSVTGSTADAVLGLSVATGTDDPSWTTSAPSPLSYCPPCPNPPCGQTNSPCATLTVNGVGASAQGPLPVSVPAGTTLSLAWSGPGNQPFALIGTPTFAPGQNFGSGLVVDVDIVNMIVLLSGFDPLLGPLFFTGPNGLATQTFTVPATAAGAGLNVQGLVWDFANACSGVGFMTTASFALQF